jgi:O-antigen ligase
MGMRLAALALYLSLLSLAAIRVSALGLLAATALVVWDDLPKGRLRILPPILVSMAVMGLLLISPETRRRLDETRDEWRSFRGDDTVKQTNARVFIWKHGLSSALEAPIFGQGLGDANDALQVKLSAEKALFWDGTGHYTLSEHRYNYHNAFLQQWAESGIIGLILFAGLFFFLFQKGSAFESRLFGWVCAISFATESMLDRQAGVFFFSFFFALIAVNAHRTKPRESGGSPQQRARLFAGRSATP